jgi:hypothetical protein
MMWERLGRIFCSAGQRPWMVSHASVPTPEPLGGDLMRIYFTPRDGHGRSHVGWLIVDMREPTRVLEISEDPSLAPGPLGAFDDAGAMFSWIVTHAGRRWLYYIGWNVGGRTPWRTAIGLASAEAGSGVPRFERHAQGPILDRSADNPFFVTNPCVRVEGSRWRMWYLSGLGWQESPSGPLPRYDVRHAESDNGITWRTTSTACLTHGHPGEVAIGRPCVLHDGATYSMFYSYRGDTFPYRMGYAESPDGLDWTRMDDSIVFRGAANDWDQAMAYPTVFDHGGQRYMLYCGNQYSKAGFGVAVLAR